MREAKASSDIGHPCSAKSAVQSETGGSRALFPASRRAATRPSMDQAPAPHAARMSMPPAMARAFLEVEQLVPDAELRMEQDRGRDAEHADHDDAAHGDAVEDVADRVDRGLVG